MIHVVDLKYLGLKLVGYSKTAKLYAVQTGKGIRDKMTANHNKQRFHKYR